MTPHDHDGDPERQLRHALRHRVRNLLAVIRGIAARTAQTRRDPDDFHQHFSGRLDAIGRAEAAVLTVSGADVTLGFMIAEEMLAHGAREEEQFTVSGPEVKLSANALLPLWLATHELIVNSVKFGALRQPGKPIDIQWCVDPQGRVLHLLWTEPTSADPASSVPGFGTQVIEKTLAYQIGGTGTLHIGTDRVECRLELPLRNVVVG